MRIVMSTDSNAVHLRERLKPYLDRAVHVPHLAPLTNCHCPHSTGIVSSCSAAQFIRGCALNSACQEKLEGGVSILEDSFLEEA